MRQPKRVPVELKRASAYEREDWLSLREPRRRRPSPRQMGLAASEAALPRFCAGPRREIAPTSGFRPAARRSQEDELEDELPQTRPAATPAIGRLSRQCRGLRWWSRGGSNP